MDAQTRLVSGYQYVRSDGKTVHLNRREGKNKTWLYFFTKQYRPDECCDLPAGYEPAENGHMTYLKRKSQ